ncbi:MAG: Choline-sulfatase [uncultured Chloroflexi bacterium]|uniref:Choline-sulfatase n=1 Tax=uncultured Chloroflexota bacterium TaxID=166587 RepID=A0A6J4HRG2_9CHLR|nr:MAG: Choline-sulfatase [uncultured Chloroflexota bacterium]
MYGDRHDKMTRDPASSAARPDRPNILVLMVDELNVGAMRVYGHPFVQTPNLDRLAAEGVTVERAYCSSPLCVPSRAAFMTGRHPHQLGVYDLASSLSSEEPTWAHLLNAAGYDTALAGKMHFVGADQRHGFKQRLVEDCHGDGSHHGVPDWDAAPRTGRPRSPRLTGAGRAGRTRYTDYDESVRDAAVAYLRERAADAQQQPFALCASFISPHFPLVVEERFFNLYWPELADLPRHPEPPDHPKYQRIRQFFSLEGPFEEEVIRRCRAAYFGLVTFVDELIGSVLAALRETGLAENTFVLFTGDHGEMLGERGLWWKSCMLEGAARVPLICSLPGRLPAGERRANVAGLVDVLPTLLDVAGVACPGFIEGSSLLPVLESGNAAWKDEALVEFLAHTARHPEAALIRKTDGATRKLIYGLHEEAQLYDLDADPDELVNLARLPAHHSELRDMERELLSRWPAEALDHAVRRSQQRRRYVAAGTESTLTELET